MTSKGSDIFTRAVSGSVSIDPLIVFRVSFGLLTLVSSIRFLLLNWIDYQYANSAVKFKYFGFEWVPYPGEAGLLALYLLMIAASIGITLGAFYRISALLFFICFTWVELIDLTYYLNHYYFVSLVALLLVFVPAHRACSIDALRRPATRSSFAPAWSLRILQFQVAIVYVYAGLMKINSEWLLRAMPLRLWLPAQTDTPLIGPLLAWPETAYIFSWSVVLFDCTIVFWLLWSKTRPWAYAIILMFHALSGYWFQIGVFPLVMSTLVLVMFPESFHTRLVNAVKRLLKSASANVQRLPAHAGPKPNRFLVAALGCWVAFQLLFPFRYLLYPGNLFWTEEGFRFSWRVMLVEKAGDAQFYVRDERTGREGAVVNSDFLNEHQIKQMSFQPDMILQFAHWLAAHFAERGVKEPRVRAEVYVTWNGRPGALLFDPQLDLTALRDGWAPKTWLYPAPQP